MARRASVIYDLRKEYKNIILLDAGDFFWKRDMGEVRAEVTADAMNMMGYNALNIADGELSFGIDFLKKYTNLKSQYVSSNIKLAIDDNLFHSYILHKSENITIGVFGIVSEKFVDTVHADQEGLIIRDPVESLQNAIESAGDTAEFLILLSHTGWEETLQLLEKVKGIGLAIVAHDYYTTFDPVKVGDTLVVKNGIGAKHIGIIKLWFSPSSNRLQEYKTELKEMDSRIKIYPEFTLPESKYEKKKTEFNQTKKKSEAQKRVLDNFSGLLNLSPEEAVRTINEKRGMGGESEINSEKED